MSKSEKIMAYGVLLVFTSIFTMVVIELELLKYRIVIYIYLVIFGVLFKPVFEYLGLIRRYSNRE